MRNILKDLRPEKIRNWVLLLLIFMVLLGFASVIDNYLNARLFNRISTSVAIFAILAVGQTLVVLTRNIDLSVGSIVGISAYIVGQQLSQHNEMAPMTAVLLAIVIGSLLGAFNGYFVAYLKIPAIIVTLGTLALFRTILVEYSDAQTVLAVELPQWIHDLPRMNVFSYERFHLRYVVAGMLIVVISFQLILRYTSFGRKLYAIGSNPEAAKLTGFANQKIIFIAFILCGALAGLAGFIFLVRIGQVTVVAGIGFELKSVAAVVVGGVNIFGGSGSVLGAFMGAVLIDLIENSLIRWLEISEFWRDALLGILILVSVATDTVIMKKLRTFWLKKQIQTKIDIQ